MQIKSTGQKRLVLATGRAHPELAKEIATLLDTELVPTTSYDFANGEIFVRFDESVRGVDAFVIQSHSAPINDQLMEQLIMVDALKRASAKRITVVSPLFPYARQDKKHNTTKDKTRPRQEETRQTRQARQDRQDKTRQDKTGKTRLDKTRK